MIEINNFSKSFNNKILFNNLNYTFKDCGFYIILANSGTGKTTLLNCIAGIDKEYNGSIEFNGLDTKINRNDFAFIFQSFNLFENDTVYNNLYLISSNKINAKKENIDKEIDNVLKKLEIDKLKNEMVKNLSGGEKQRVSIARAILNYSKVYFCDEPTGSLDFKNSQEIFNILLNLSQDSLVICVTHDDELAYKYGNYILKIVNGKLKEIKNKRITKKDSNFIGLELQKEKKISFKFLFYHYKNNFKNRKIRNLLGNAFTTISLLFLGISFVIGISLKDSIYNSFKESIGSQSLVLARNEEINYNDFEVATYDEIYDIYKEYSSDIEYLGVDYLNNFDEFFKTENQLYNVSLMKKELIEGFNIRHFNEFEYIDINNLTNCFPVQKNKLNEDEIIIGLDYSMVKKICLYFQIPRTYESLGSYIETGNFNVALYLSNNEWNYSDEQIFKIKGIIPSNVPIIYHTNPLFNKILFEDNMRLPVVLKGNIRDFPWILEKIYFLKTKLFENIFLDKFLIDNRYKNYFFEIDSSDYSPLTVSRGKYTNRLFCYYYPNEIFDYSITDQVRQIEDNLNYFYYSTNEGFYSSGLSLLNGSVNDLFFLQNSVEIDNFIDKFSVIDKDEYDNLVLPSTILKSSYSSLNEDNLKFSTIYTISHGKEIENILDIGISSKIANKFNLKVGDLVYLVLNNKTTIKGNNYVKEFIKVEFNVSFISDEDSYIIYQKSMFSIDLFRDLFQISAFNLIPKGIIFENNDLNVSYDLKKINKYFYNYTFYNVLSNLKESLNSTMFYIEVIILIIGIILSFFSLTINTIINFVSIDDSKREYSILYCLDFSFKEIMKFKCYEIVVQSLINLILSGFSLLFLTFLMEKYLGNYLGFALKFTFSYKVLFLLLLVGLISMVISCLFIIKPIKNIDFKKELH